MKSVIALNADGYSGRGRRCRRARPVLGWALLCGLLLSGCTMIPRYERPAAPVAENYPRVADTNESHAAEISWRNFVAEDRLRELIERALANNRDLRVATLNVEQSRAQYRVSRSALLPTVDATGNYTRSQASLAGFPGGGSGGASSFKSTLWSASLGTTAYELDLFGRVRSLNRQALQKFFSTAEARRSAQISLVSEVASTYFTLRQAEEQLRLAHQTLGAVQESYELNRATFEAGASTELDLRTAEGQVESAKISLRTYERQVAQAQNSMVLLLGESMPPELSAPRPFSDTNLLADVPSGLPSELAQRRPDIVQAEHKLEAANASIGAARAAFFPVIMFTGSFGTTSSQLDKLFGSGTGVWTFAPQISLPLFTGGKNRADLEAARIGVRIEVANYEKAIQTAFREVADALVARETYGQQVQEEGLLIAAQQRRYELADARYRQGEDTYLSVLLAQQDLYSAQQGLLTAQYNKLASQISLYKALGGGWQ